jgi:hypothetical protein
MFKKFSVSAIFLFVLTLGMPLESLAGDRNSGRTSEFVKETTFEQGKNKGWNQGKSRKGPYRGYKNYGQYRSSQVGNRRYRWVRRPYYRNGIRLFRNIRIYY